MTPSTTFASFVLSLAGLTSPAARTQAPVQAPVHATEAAPAQAAAQDPVQPPTLLRLGPVPAGAPAATVAAAGAIAPVLPAGATELVLHADQRTPMAAVDTALAAARAHGIAAVHLVARLPDGTPGALTLALPGGREPVDPSLATVTLRAHRERPGVPAESAVPLLRRLGDAWREHGKGPFVLGVSLPANATYGHLLALLAAGASSGAPSAIVLTSAAVEGAHTGALALDLESAFVAAVAAREQAPGVAVLERAAVGMPTAAPTLPPPAPVGGRAGVRYGGRIGAAQPHDDELREAIERSVTFLLRQQRADGSLPDAHGRGDVEATALLTLVLLGQGRSLDGGPESAPVRRSVGWLLANQYGDGRFADAGPGAVRQHALATWALTEAAGMSARGALFRPCAQLALDWLKAQRHADGGWNDGSPDAASEAFSTAAAATAVASASFFGAKSSATTGAITAWFDDHGSTTADTAAAELLARHFAGQTGGTAPLGRLADTTLTADAADPGVCWWATMALFQTGGEHWTKWRDRLVAEILPRQVTSGADAGGWPATPRASAVTATAHYTLALAAARRYTRLVR